MQQHYDYTNDKGYSELSDKIDHLTPTELSAVLQALVEAKEDAQAKRAVKAKEWFDRGILEVLKDYAQMSFATLDIIEEPELVFLVSLTSAYGFDIVSNKWMHKICSLADEISTEAFGDNSVMLELVFDLNFD